MPDHNDKQTATQNSQAAKRWPLAALILTLLVLVACSTSGGAGGQTAMTAPPENTPSVPTSLPASTAPVQAPTAPAAPGAGYDIGQPVLTDLYVSPQGDDSHDGLSSSTPLKTITAAWAKIPAGTTLAKTGFRINLLPGAYPCEPAEPDDCRNAFGDRHGTYEFPVIVRAANGAGSATIRGGFDLSNLSYLYLIDVRLAGGAPLPTNQSGNNLLHLASVDHVLLRNVTLDGPDCTSDTCNNLQEVLKVNQAQYVYVENSQIGGAWHSAVDYFSVQYGHFLNNRLHTTGQWCMYVKGGTAYLRVEGNELHDCQLGFQAGQSSNLAVMRAPWVQYEAYDVRFVNNVLHDIPGVGMSVSGGYNILFAYNTLYRVATSSDPGYALFQAVHGERGCTPTDEVPDAVAVCQALIGKGAWGPSIVTDNLPSIPNSSVYVYNNLIVNPAPAKSLYAHFNIAAPIERPAGFQNLPASIAADENLVVAGNLIWNGPADHPLGVDDTTGCAAANPTCNPAQLASANTINAVEPQLVDPSAGNYRPASGSAVFGAAAVPVPDFTWAAFNLPVPTGALTNEVSADRDGKPRSGAAPPGAYATSGS